MGMTWNRNFTWISLINEIIAPKFEIAEVDYQCTTKRRASAGEMAFPDVWRHPWDSLFCRSEANKSGYRVCSWTIFLGTLFW